MTRLFMLMMIQLAVFALPGCAAPLTSIPEAKGIVKVIDEQDNPIPDANVELGFQYHKPPKLGEGWAPTTVTDHAVGKTDAKRVFKDRA